MHFTNYLMPFTCLLFHLKQTTACERKSTPKILTVIFACITAMVLIRVVRNVSGGPSDTDEPQFVNISEEVLATAITLHASSTLDNLADTREAIIVPLVAEHEEAHEDAGISPWNDPEPAVAFFRGPSQQLQTIELPPADTTIPLDPS